MKDSTEEPQFDPEIWADLEREVVRRIRVLAAIMATDAEVESDVKSNIWDDLVRPNVDLLLKFCTNIRPVTDDVLGRNEN